MAPPGHMADRHLQYHGISSQEEYDLKLRQRLVDKEAVTLKVLDPSTPNEDKMVRVVERWHGGAPLCRL